MASSTSLLGEIIDRYETLALRFLESRIRDPETARDLYQDVVAAVLRSGKEFASAEHLRNYFFVALRNASIDHEKARRRAREVELPEDVPVSAVEGRAAEDPADRLIAEEDLARERKRAEALDAALRGLSGLERQLLRWRFYERRTFREIQEATGDPISTLKSREDAILRKLKKAIGKVGGEE